MKTLLKRLWLEFKINSLTIHTLDLRRAFMSVNDQRARIDIAFAIEDAEAELAALWSRYNATLPAGQRKTWKVA